MKTLLKAKTNEFKTQVNTMMDTLMTQALTLQNIQHIDGEQFEMLKQCYNMVSTANEIVVACVEVITETNSNTEKILALLRHTYTEPE